MARTTLSNQVEAAEMLEAYFVEIGPRLIKDITNVDIPFLNFQRVRLRTNCFYASSVSPF